MALTTSSRFKYVVLTWNSVQDIWNSTYYELDETDSEQVVISFPLSTAEIAKLDILKEIYSSSDGLRNAAGDSIIANVTQHPTITDAADLEENGIVNPLLEGSTERLANLKKVMGAFLRHGSVEEDTTSGRLDILLSGGFVPELTIPFTGELTQSLEDWTGYAAHSSAVRLELIARSGIQYADATVISVDARVRALVKWMDDHRTVGSQMWTGDLESIDAWTDIDFFGGRRYTFDQDASDTTNTVTVRVNGTSIGGTGLDVTIIATSGILSLSLVNSLFDNTTVELVTGRAEEEPPFGDVDIPVSAERIKFRGGQIRDMKGFPVWEKDSIQNVIGSSYGRVVQLGSLEYTTGDNYYTAPLEYGLFGIHDVTSFQRNLRIPKPSGMVPVQGGEIEFEIRKSGFILDPDFYIDVQDHDGNPIIRVLPGESIAFRSAWHDTGGGELYVPSNVSKVYELAGGNIGSIGGESYIIASTSPTRYMRPIHVPNSTESTVDTFDDTIFERGTSTIYNGSSHDSAGTFTRASIKIKKSGILHYDLTVQMAVSGTGIFDAGYTIYFYKNGVRQLPGVTYVTDLVDGEGITWRLTYELAVVADDIITPFLEYSSGITMATSSMLYSFYRCRAELLYPVSVNYLVA